ncbi:response regulator transcription factor [Marinobacter sp. F4206]|uniref:response regulator transcription factor n=1 Tax=Marinobacter sp. F4206 TaxID=2861777 RepID=UPI001C5F81EA|nr:response regulator [Marinobacter sp. F4206]MBW4936027.1 response regulator [Marinobacter sp. F4206]
MNGLTPTVYVVDDDDSFLLGISRLLRAEGYVVEAYGSASEFFENCPQVSHGCVIADLKMPGMDGLTMQRQIAQSGNPLPIIFFTGHRDIHASVSAIRNGAEDFLLKTMPKDELLAAIVRALAHDAENKQKRHREAQLLDRYSKLTPREKEVLLHVLRGRLNKQIAGDLGIDERSVKRHRTNFMRKLNVASVPQLARLSMELGITVELEDVTANALKGEAGALKIQGSPRGR